VEADGHADKHVVYPHAVEIHQTPDGEQHIGEDGQTIGRQGHRRKGVLVLPAGIDHTTPLLSMEGVNPAEKQQGDNDVGQLM